MFRLLYDYIDVNMAITCLFSVYVVLDTFLTNQFNRLNTVYFKTMAHCVCCVWDSLVWVWGSECVLCVGQFGVGLWE